MNRHLVTLGLSLVVALGVTMSFSSCKDDDDDGKSKEQQEQELQQQRDKFWDVVGQLVDPDDITDDYKHTTFEPTIGIADESNPFIRIVNTNGMAVAAQRFADLVGVTDIDENTPSYTYSDPDVGTLTYTRVGEASEWATVDVDIRQVPTLQKIVYRVGGEGDNGSFSGRAYYRFGDVVSREVTIAGDNSNGTGGTVTEYWICVRPAFGKEGKEESHWVCVNTMSDKNYKYYKTTDGSEYWVPNNLLTDKEDMQNFAEMLWAICNPEQWFENVNKQHKDGILFGFSGLPVFTDFKKKNIDYHNQWFWTNVQEAWKRYLVADKALNVSYDQLASNISSNGVNLLYKGYNWSFLKSWTCMFYEAGYTNGTKGSEQNLHKSTYSSFKANMERCYFDCREMGQATANYQNVFADSKLRWVIRHATGKELSASGKAPVQEPLKGVTEVYRYYRDVNRSLNLDVAPEITAATYADVLDEPRVGCVIGIDGKFHSSADQPVAIVVYVGEKGSVETGTDYRGLALALNNAGGSPLASARWMSGNDYGNCTQTIDPIFKATLPQQLNGIRYTRRLLNDGHSHPAVEQCRDYAPKLGEGFSDWFLPSTGQWILMAKGLFGADWQYGAFIIPGYDSFINGESTFDKILHEANIYAHDFPYGRWMWSVIESSDTDVWQFMIDDDGIELNNYGDKTNYNPVIPMIAF